MVFGAVNEGKRVGFLIECRVIQPQEVVPLSVNVLPATGMNFQE